MGVLSMIAQLGLNSSNFNKGIAQAEMMARKFSKSVAHELQGMVGGYLTLGYAVELMSESFAKASEIKDLSLRLGMDVETLQEMQYAAQQTGASIEDFAVAIKNLNKSRAEALADPNGEKAGYFHRFGIGLKELKTLSGEAIFMTIGQAVRDAVNPQNELNNAVEILGKVAPTTFTAMREGLIDLANEARKSGQVLDKEVIDKLDKTQKKYDKAKNQVGNTLANAAYTVYDAIAKYARFLGAKSVTQDDKEAMKVVRQMDKEEAAEDAKKEARTKATEFDAAIKSETNKTKAKAKELVPAEYSYKPQSDEISRIGGFTRSAQNAMVASLDMIKEATMKTAENTATIASNNSGGNFP